jgi:hypothetical protein
LNKNVLRSTLRKPIRLDLQAMAEAKQAEAEKEKPCKMPWLRLRKTSECMRKKPLRPSLSYSVLSLCSRKLGKRQFMFNMT